MIDPRAGPGKVAVTIVADTDDAAKAEAERCWQGSKALYANEVPDGYDVARRQPGLYRNPFAS